MRCKIQNTNYFGMMKCKIPKFSGLRLVLSKIQNLLLLLWPLEALLGLVRFGRNGPFCCSIRVDCCWPVLKPSLPQNALRFGLAWKEIWLGLAIPPPSTARNKAQLPTLRIRVRAEAARGTREEEKQRSEATTSTRRT
jgi:hypothetical protein